MRPKRTEYAVSVDRSGRAAADGLAPIHLDEAWTPEHIVLLGLAQCSVASFRHHARRATLDFVATAVAVGAVARRDDGSWGFVELECRIEVQLDPVPPGEGLVALLAKAERGCFVGASMVPKPAYRWRVNGNEVT